MYICPSNISRTIPWGRRIKTGSYIGNYAMCSLGLMSSWSGKALPSSSTRLLYGRWPGAEPTTMMSWKVRKINYNRMLCDSIKKIITDDTAATGGEAVVTKTHIT